MNIDNIINGKPIKVWREYILAAVIGVLFNSVYIIVDGIFIGQGVGEAGVAAINIVWPSVTVLLGLSMMFGTGAASLISVSLGANDKDNAEKILSVTIKWMFLFGIILMIVGIVFAHPIVSLMGAEEDTYELTYQYHIVIFSMAVPYIFSSAMTMLVRSDDNPRLSMILVSIGAIVNVILDYIFIMILGMGMIGAALATGAGVIISSVVGLWYFTIGKSKMKIRKEQFKFDFSILIKTSKIGFASFVVQFSSGIIILVKNYVLYTYGTTQDIAIYCIAGYVNALYTQISFGISQGMQPLIGCNYGAKNFSRMKTFLKMTLICSVALGVLSLCLVGLFGIHIVRLFGIDESSAMYAYSMVFVFSAGAPFVGIAYTYGAYYQALSQNVKSNIISVGRSFVLQMIFSLVLPLFIGTLGIFYGQSLADLFAMFIVLGIIAFERISHKKLN